ncbi:hypothetical protein N7462_005737 [Penicillium macrosclerotiorum]|uniref:uncharacterized protein n=1 Tax=Penicillium macrosclerotiorum TaxID=303699 RepID=UPI002548319F|nr:uncharacterized protein N7462_005737 [Penicillium macrosclerotiorum]KAJ5682572.1 hypothetical protein N7462_005737 [Penicillium macrosclerotiorum]
MDRLRVPVLRTSRKIFAPFHTLKSRLTRIFGLYRLGSSDSPESPTWSDSELKLLEERSASERNSLEHLPSAEPRNSPSKLCLMLGIMTNIVSTTSIVFTNKYIFSHEGLRNCQLAFAAYHFLITGLTLWAISQLRYGDFVAKRIPIYRNFHLVTLTSAQVVLQNLSLAYSSVIFHQLVRLLLTPATALFGFLFYRATIPSASIIPLVILCGGVGVTFYCDSHSMTDKNAGTSLQGVVFAFTGVLTSALYTTLIGTYQKKLQVNSMQLLLNQAPMSAGFLMCLAPFIDTSPTATALSPSVCFAIFGSGMLACLVNVSQFYVINAVGPVNSTVIGHLKTCMIVGLGWFISDQPISMQSVVGIIMALLGMSL